MASMVDEPLILRESLPAIHTIHPESKKLVTGVKIKAAGESKLNESPDLSKVSDLER